MSYQTTSFTYDPARQGYDTNSWRTISGNPAVNAGRLAVDSGAGQGSVIHYADFVKGDITFNVNIPTIPGNNSSRFWGVSTGRSDEYIRFAIDENFTCQVANGSTTAESDAITWNSAWTGANVEFRIRWESGTAKFFINGTQVYAVTSDAVPHGPLSLYAYDESGSPMTIGLVRVRGTQSFVMNLKTTDTTNFSGGLIVMSDALTVSESVTIQVV